MAVSSPGKSANGDALDLTLRRLLDQAGRAVKSFPRDPADKAHFIRTRVKHLQSLCRLVPAGKLWREQFLGVLRELKDIFAPTRDATIVKALSDKYAPGQNRHAIKVGAPDLARAGELVLQGKKSLREYAGWSDLAWEDIAVRVVGAYRAARNAWKMAARKNAPDAAFHDCRRRVKRLLYQCEYLGGRARMSRFVKRVDRLGEVFGEIQDVCLAEEWLLQNKIKVPADLPRSKEHLRQEALKKSAALLAPKPKDFRRLLG